MRKIPVFLSCPTQLNSVQERKKGVLIKILDDLQMEPRSLGRTDYPKDYPLREVYVIAKHCSGGLILGFEQLLVEKGVYKKGTKEEDKINEPIPISTPWNQLEAGILFGLGIPLLIFKEEGMKGGIFDHGVTDIFIHKMPPSKPNKSKFEELKQIIIHWQSEVIRKYYE